MPLYKVVLACDVENDLTRPPHQVTGFVRATDSRDVHQQNCTAEAHEPVCPARRSVLRIESVRHVDRGRRRADGLRALRARLGRAVAALSATSSASVP